MNDEPNRPFDEQAPPPYPPPPSSAQTLPPRYQRPPGGQPPPRRSLFRRLLAALLVTALIMFILFVIGVALMVFRGNRGGGSLAFGDKIGLVRISGIISQGEDKDFWMDALRRLGENKHVRGIVVRLDTPGGTVGASQEIYSMVARIRRHKPVYVSMGDVSASGGYYIASASERIYALKGTLTGSIGVIFTAPQIGELTKKLGIATETIKSGRFKDSGSIVRPMSPEERQMFNFLIDDTFGQFRADILQFRRKPLDQAMRRFTDWQAFQFTRPDPLTAETFLGQIADGRAYTGEQALRLGLVDEIGTLDDTIEALGNRLGIKGRPSLIEYERPKGLGQLLRSQMGNVLPTGHASLQYLMTLP